MRLAAILSLVGLVAMAVGMRLGAGSPNSHLTQGALAIARSNALSKWLMLYFTTTILCQIITTFAAIQSGLTQFMLALANLNWAFLFTLTFAAMARGVYWFRLVICCRQCLADCAPSNGSDAILSGRAIRSSPG